MTDNDIKKSLECCLAPKHDCSYCLLEKEVYCTSLLHKNILELINRQQAEIERLQNTIDDVLDRQPLLVERAEKYAIKEFAERLKEAIIQENDLYVKCAKNLLSTDYQQGYEEKNNTIVKCIDNLLEEKVGEQNA